MSWALNGQKRGTCGSRAACFPLGTHLVSVTVVLVWVFVCFEVPRLFGQATIYSDVTIFCTYCRLPLSGTFSKGFLGAFIAWMAAALSGT